MEEEFIRSADGSETVTDDKEATIRNLIAEVARLRGILQLCESASLQRAEGLQHANWRANNDHYDGTADGDKDWES